MDEFDNPGFINKPTFLLNPVRSVFIENFRSFGSEQSLPLSGATFLFGPNSQGKTSALHAINLLLNRWRKLDFSTRDITFVDNSPSIFISGQIKHNGIENKSIKFGYEYGITVGDTGMGFRETSYLIKVTLELGEADDKKLKSITIHITPIDENKKKGETEEFINISRGEESGNNASIFIDQDSQFLKDEFDWDNHQNDKFDAKHGVKYDRESLNKVYEIFFKEIEFDWRKMQIIDKILKIDNNKDKIIAKSKNFSKSQQKLVSFINSIIKTSLDVLPPIHDKVRGWIEDDFSKNIGPNRKIPDKSSFNGIENIFLEPQFLKTSIINDLNLWIKKNNSIVSLDYEFVKLEVENSLKDTIYQIGLKEISTGEYRRFDEVGSGITHIFQILLPLFDEDLRLLTIQQPEVHLHPSKQVELTRAILTIAKERSKQVIFETHSEHIIKTAQLMVAEGLSSGEDIKIRKNDISVLYIKKNDAGESTVRKIELEEDGSFAEPWPDDFFELSADLTMARLRSSIKARN